MRPPLHTLSSSRPLSCEQAGVIRFEVEDDQLRGTLLVGDAQLAARAAALPWGGPMETPSLEQHQGKHYVLLPETLLFSLEQAQDMPPRVAFAILLRLSEALDQAHDHGVWHGALHADSVGFDELGRLRVRPALHRASVASQGQAAGDCLMLGQILLQMLGIDSVKAIAQLPLQGVDPRSAKTIARGLMRGSPKLRLSPARALRQALAVLFVRSEIPDPDVPLRAWLAERGVVDAELSSPGKIVLPAPEDEGPRRLKRAIPQLAQASDLEPAIPVQVEERGLGLMDQIPDAVALQLGAADEELTADEASEYNTYEHIEDDYSEVEPEQLAMLREEQRLRLNTLMGVGAVRVGPAVAAVRIYPEEAQALVLGEMGIEDGPLGADEGLDSAELDMEFREMSQSGHEIDSEPVETLSHGLDGDESLSEVAADRAEADRAEADRAEADRAEADRAEADRAEAERVAEEAAQAERRAVAQAQTERPAAETQAAEAQEAELQRLAGERAAEQAEREDAEREDAEKSAAERDAAEALQTDEQQAKAIVLVEADTAVEQKAAAEERAAAESAAEESAAEESAAEESAAEESAAAQEAKAAALLAEQEAQTLRDAEQKAAENEAAKLRDAELEAAEQKAAEKEAAKLKDAELEAAEQQAAKLRDAEQKLAEAAQLRAAAQKAAEKEAAKLRDAELEAAEQQAAKLRDAEQKLAEAAQLRAAAQKAAEKEAAQLRDAELSAADQKAPEKKAPEKKLRAEELAAEREAAAQTLAAEQAALLAENEAAAQAEQEAERARAQRLASQADLQTRELAQAERGAAQSVRDQAHAPAPEALALKTARDAEEEAAVERALARERDRVAREESAQQPPPSSLELPESPPEPSTPAPLQPEAEDTDQDPPSVNAPVRELPPPPDSIFERSASSGEAWLDSKLAVGGHSEREQELGAGKWTESGRSAKELSEQLPDSPVREMQIQGQDSSGRALLFGLGAAALVLGGSLWMLLSPPSATTITLQTHPQGLRVFIDGQDLGRAPTTYALPPGQGEHELCTYVDEIKQCRSMQRAQLRASDPALVDFSQTP